MRLWIHNRQARALPMWEKLLKRPGVSVALFEPEKLDVASNIVNALGSRIYLYLPALLDSDDGIAAVNSLLERFIHDPLWKSSIYPFSRMASRRLRRDPVELLNAFGFAPDRYEIRIEEGSAPTSLSDAVVKFIIETGSSSLDNWLIDRQPCMYCDHLSICGAALAAGDGRSCSPIAMSMVQQISESADRMKQDLIAIRNPIGENGDA